MWRKLNCFSRTEREIFIIKIVLLQGNFRFAPAKTFIIMWQAMKGDKFHLWNISNVQISHLKLFHILSNLISLCTEQKRWRHHYWLLVNYPYTTSCSVGFSWVKWDTELINLWLLSNILLHNHVRLAMSTFPSRSSQLVLFKMSFTYLSSLEYDDTSPSRHSDDVDDSHNNANLLQTPKTLARAILLLGS